MAGLIFLKECNNKRCISLVILLLCWSYTNFGCMAQDDFGGDDPGADTTGNDATQDMLEENPENINPQDCNILGTCVPTPKSPNPKPGKSNKDSSKKTKSIGEQTEAALMQFGVLVRTSTDDK